MTLDNSFLIFKDEENSSEYDVRSQFPFPKGLLVREQVEMGKVEICSLSMVWPIDNRVGATLDILDGQNLLQITWKIKVESPKKVN